MSMFCVTYVFPSFAPINAMAFFVSFNSFYSYLLIFRENTVWKCSKLQKSCSGVSFSPEHISIFTWRNSHFLEFLQVNNENVFGWRKLLSGDGIVFSRIEIVHSDRVLLVIGLSCFQSGELAYKILISLYENLSLLKFCIIINTMQRKNVTTFSCY